MWKLPAARVSVLLAAVMITAAAAACSTSPAGSGTAIGAGSVSSKYAKNVEYSQCMRAHGDTIFPDPNSQGNFVLQNPESQPDYNAANSVCAHLKAGGPENQQVLQQIVARWLQFARCMRAHGEPNYPDPGLSADGGVDTGDLSGLHPKSPQFQDAQRACRSFLPAGFPGF